ncbi:hypothetical protein M514_06890 [Trichuris suis]|uniref:Uncharacterized protein n=1 Tax=Trichuris suis TaxID=68888 RepID=A0A085NLN7_9BILA|nr:hypothetical protein M513_06890 [Trichuris suis]KFD70383.1 hypothetical protein M514_06890 [Trichuris suis]KHJ47891.1 hypothetical protein D918_02050 [Trichuris suis]
MEMRGTTLFLLIVFAQIVQGVIGQGTMEKARRSNLEDFLSQLRGEALLNSRMRFGKRRVEPVDPSYQWSTGREMYNRIYPQAYRDIDALPDSIVLHHRQLPLPYAYP